MLVLRLSSGAPQLAMHLYGRLLRQYRQRSRVKTGKDGPDPLDALFRYGVRNGVGISISFLGGSQMG